MFIDRGAGARGAVYAQGCALISLGLGRRLPQTANSPYFNPPVVCFYATPLAETEEYPFQLGGDNFTQTLTYGQLARDAGGEARIFHRRREGPLASPRPYINYGTAFKTRPMRVDDDASRGFKLRPLGAQRWGAAGDVEYATMNPDANSVYNARSVLIIFPESAVLSPRSMGRLKFYLKKVFPGSINLRVRRDKGEVMLELLSPTASVNSIQQKVGDVFVDIPLSRRYDVVSHQVYSGME